MEQLDRQLLDHLQTNLPLVPAPYAALGERLGLGDEEVRARVERLRRARIIRQISAIFDSRKLGYQSSLVAFDVDPTRLDEVAAVVNGHPGVSHNYQRDFELNLWFTIAVPPGGELAGEVERLAATEGVRRARLLPTIRVFKVGVQLGMGSEDADSASRSGAPEPETAGTRPKPMAEEIAAIRVLQRDLPAVERPFAALAAESPLEESTVLRYGRELLADGRMRRFAAVLHHREAGFEHNAMVLWAVPEGEIERAGRTMASFDAVSHCYQRPHFDDLPYSLYTMIHGRRAQDCESVVEAISRATGLDQHRLVYSTREFKKVRVRYFEEQ
jgi:DNA-binding Lrp family transcriptional regulator